jgi:hypothetical protein
MACGTVRHATVEVALDTKDQTHEKVREIVDAILRQNSAIECGIMGAFSISFAESSGRVQESTPSAELKKLGVVSLKTTAGT